MGRSDRPPARPDAPPAASVVPAVTAFTPDDDTGAGPRTGWRRPTDGAHLRR
ncbi:hypothetical protein ACWDCC_05460 [Streptomyces sp. NPDC001102]